MSNVSLNFETLPIDVIALLMYCLADDGFESCFNLFLAWARSQRPSMIPILLKNLPVRSMYKYCDKGSDADKACFDRFMSIGDSLGVADAVLYQSCRGILCAGGNIQGHLAAIQALASGGHYASMIANFIVRSLYKRESSNNTVQALVGIFSHPEYKYGIGPFLTDLNSIYVSSGCPRSSSVPYLSVVCPNHLTDQQTPTFNDHTGSVDCFFCTTNLMLKAFAGGASIM